MLSISHHPHQITIVSAVKVTNTSTVAAAAAAAAATMMITTTIYYPSPLRLQIFQVQLNLLAQ